MEIYNYRKIIFINTLQLYFKFEINRRVNIK
jgi:hypothetical protein